jgi:hypothetical protein
MLLSFSKSIPRFSKIKTVIAEVRRQETGDRRQN